MDSKIQIVDKKIQEMESLLRKPLDALVYPNRRAFDLGRKILMLMRENELEKVYFWSLWQGGLAICFFRRKGEYYAAIYCNNDGSTAALLSREGATGCTETVSHWVVYPEERSITDTLVKFNAFFDGI